MINCENSYVENCEKCNLCLQIDNNTLPNFITITPDGATIKKSQIIELKEKMLTKPIYSKYNTYVILNAEKLNSSSANTMLKFIEEPEENIVGFFITNNKENIIDTIRSRCQIIIEKFNINEVVEDNKLDYVIEDFIKNIELDNKHSLLYNKNVFLENKFTREDVLKIFIKIFSIYENIYLYKNADDKYNFLLNLSSKDLEKKLRIINNTINDISCNGNINLILDSFAIEMR